MKHCQGNPVQAVKSTAVHSNEAESKQDGNCVEKQKSRCTTVTVFVRKKTTATLDQRLTENEQTYEYTKGESQHAIHQVLCSTLQ